MLRPEKQRLLYTTCFHFDHLINVSELLLLIN